MGKYIPLISFPRGLPWCSRFRALSVSILSFAFAGLAVAQSAKPPTQPVPLYVPPAPHTNAPLPDIPSMPGDGDGAYRTGNYRDLFAEIGHTQAETRAKIDRAFQQLFHGDARRSASTSRPGRTPTVPLAPMDRWANAGPSDRGQGYGMMIAGALAEGA